MLSFVEMINENVLDTLVEYTVSSLAWLTGKVVLNYVNVKGFRRGVQFNTSFLHSLKQLK